MVCILLLLLYSSAVNISPEVPGQIAQIKAELQDAAYAMAETYIPEGETAGVQILILFTSFITSQPVDEDQVNLLCVFQQVT